VGGALMAWEEGALCEPWGGLCHEGGGGGAGVRLKALGRVVRAAHKLRARGRRSAEAIGGV
jgi:hypothetical protein